MSILADIHEDASGAVKAAVDAAYEAGRAEGRREALAELQTHLGLFWKDAAENPAKPESSFTVGVALGQARATPGSVKPMVERMLLDAENGLTPVEIAERTGFKYNSVRGTLWALGKEGFAISQSGRWFAVRQDNEDEVLERQAVALTNEEKAMSLALDHHATDGGQPDF